MATAFSDLRDLVAYKVDDRWPENTTNTTSDGAGGGTTVINTNFAGYGDEFFAGHYLLITESTQIDTERMITAPTGGFTSSTGTFTVARAFGGQILNAITMEVHRYSNTQYLQALNSALRQGMGKYWRRRVVDESLLVDNWLANNSFNSNIAAADWVSSGSPTITYNSQYKMGYGVDGFTAARSIKIAAGGSAGSVYQDVHAASDAATTPEINVEMLTGRSVLFGMWVYATAGSTARLRLDWDGTNFQNHAYHSGSDHFEWQEVSATVPASATRVRAICEVAANGTAYFDEGYLIGPPRYRYPLGSFLLRGPTWVGVHSDPRNPEAIYTPFRYYSLEEHEATRYIILHRKPPSGYRLQLRGERAPTALTITGTSTTEVDAPDTELLSTWAGVELLKMGLGSASEDRERTLIKLKELEATLENLKRNHHIRQPAQPVQLAGWW